MHELVGADESLEAFIAANAPALEEALAQLNARLAARGVPALEQQLPWALRRLCAAPVPCSSILDAFMSLHLVVTPATCLCWFLPSVCQ